ncbi:unnamed protein product [[Candida] boidinii]|nr:unnamed protein product [[Candida] boidinii]
MLLVNGEFLTGEDSTDDNPLSELCVFNFLLSISFLFFFFGVVIGVVEAELLPEVGMAVLLDFIGDGDADTICEPLPV